jgi:hypothetical protein
VGAGEREREREGEREEREKREIERRERKERYREVYYYSFCRQFVQSFAEFGRCQKLVHPG